jgi:hypothetical protein
MESTTSPSPKSSSANIALAPAEVGLRVSPGGEKWKASGPFDDN